MDSPSELGRMRREAGMTQEALAEAITAVRRRADPAAEPVSQSYVSKLETGLRGASIEDAAEWAEACGFHLRAEFTRDGPQDELAVRAAALLPYADDDIRRAIANLLEAVAKKHLRRAVR